jgi:hypothetical protein
MSDCLAANITWAGALRLVFAVGFVGCSNAKFGEVSGQVTLDGKPLPQVAVRFEDERGSATIARTDQNGNYVLRYTVHQIGAPVGKHKVTIFTPAPETEGTGERAKAELVPAKYNRKSTLTQEIKRGSQTINFELTSKP